MSAEVVAQRMSRHIDGLAESLRAAGAPAEASMRLLELAALAAMHAASLAEVGAAEPERRQIVEPVVRSATQLSAAA